MKISVINGYSRVLPNPPTVSQGYNLVTQSRAMQGYVLNGVVTELDLFNRLPRSVRTEFMMDRLLGEPVTINGLKDWLQNRRARAGSRQSYRDARKDIRLERMRSGTDLGSRLSDIAVSTAQSLANKGLNLLPGEEAAVYDAMNETDSSGQTGGTKGLFDGGKSDLQKWWEDLSMPAKAGVVVGGIVVLDAILGGPIILQRIGVMKKKKK